MNGRGDKGFRLSAGIGIHGLSAEGEAKRGYYCPGHGHLFRSSANLIDRSVGFGISNTSIIIDMSIIMLF